MKSAKGFLSGFTRFQFVFVKLNEHNCLLAFICAFVEAIIYSYYIERSNLVEYQRLNIHEGMKLRHLIFGKIKQSDMFLLISVE